MDSPLVSICMPAYNVGSYISESIKSVIDQTYKNWELIIVDDGSTDNTLAIANKYASEQIRVISQKNKGASAARNNAFSNSTGTYIKFIDADDLINSEMLESQVALALNNHDCLITSKWGRFNNNDTSTFKLNPEECWQTLPSQQWLSMSWKNGRSMTQCAMFLLPRSIVEKAGLWDETLSLIDDFDFFTRVILNSKKIIFDDSSTLYYRSGNGSLSNLASDAGIRSAFKSIDQATKYFLQYNVSPEALTLCANVWQQFIYDMYPRFPEYITIAEKNIKELKGSYLPFPSGGYTKLLSKIIGWKACKKLKYTISKIIR
jgi:glycosyltransferase involved in cell wall biosynthesis